MTMREIAEQDREKLLTALSGAEAGPAAGVLSGELDRILYTFNDGEESPQVREAAGAMIQAAKATCPLMDCAGETKIYGRTEYGGDAPAKGRVSKWGLLFLLLGLAGIAATAVGAALLPSAGLPPRWLLAGVPVLTGVLLLCGGLLLRRKGERRKETLHAETKLDAERVYTRLLSLVLVMDKQLEELRASLRQEERERLRAEAAAMNPGELELLARLLEDAYGRRGEDGQAEEEISQIKFYLHGRSIDVVDWTPEAPPGWFDMMPAFSGGTLRPALAADGALLKKGMASAGRD